MPELEQASADETVVRGYLEALDHGRILDALSAFSLDARVRDGSGHERRGIREIAAAFVREELPVRVDVEDLEREGETVTARVRMTYPGGRRSQTYRSVFWVRRDRIQSVVMEAVPTNRLARGGVHGSA